MKNPELPADGCSDCVIGSARQAHRRNLQNIVSRSLGIEDVVDEEVPTGDGPCAFSIGEQVCGATVTVVESELTGPTLCEEGKCLKSLHNARLKFTKFLNGELQ